VIAAKFAEEIDALYEGRGESRLAANFPHSG
jgi:hypothetical protein